MTHDATPDFWVCYRDVPPGIRDLPIRTTVASPHRVLAIEVPDGVLWFWIGTHARYDRMDG